MNGFDPNDADDATEDADGDGVTNLEEFLRENGPNSGVINLTPILQLLILDEAA